MTHTKKYCFALPLESPDNLLVTVTVHSIAGDPVIVIETGSNRTFVQAMVAIGQKKGKPSHGGDETGRPAPERSGGDPPSPRYSVELIPVRLIIDACPISMADGLDSFGIVDEETPSFDASLDDVVVGVPDEGAELVFAQVFPHVFHWIEFWAIGRQGKKRDIFRYDQRAAPLMPSRAITK